MMTPGKIFWDAAGKELCRSMARTYSSLSAESIGVRRAVEAGAKAVMEHAAKIADEQAIDFDNPQWEEAARQIADAIRAAAREHDAK